MVASKILATFQPLVHIFFMHIKRHINTRRLKNNVFNLPDMKYYFILFFILSDFVDADIDKYDNNKEVEIVSFK